MGFNPYDLRRKCDRAKDGDLCYEQLKWIETYMNEPKNKAALGVNPDLTFASCNTNVNKDFMFQGDGMHNSALLLPELVNGGVRLLVYAGNAGMFTAPSRLGCYLSVLPFNRYGVQLHGTYPSPSSLFSGLT